MVIINDTAALNTPLPARIRHVLDLRRELIDLATFIIVRPGDRLTDVEDATGFPIADEAPPWEWVLDHGGVYEAPIIVSDDGTAVVLIVPEDDGIDARLLAIAREHADLATPNDLYQPTIEEPVTPRG